MELFAALAQPEANGTQLAIAVAMLITYILYGAIYVLNIFHPIAAVTFSNITLFILIKERRRIERNPYCRSQEIQSRMKRKINRRRRMRMPTQFLTG